jgi:hypothetical protein
LNGCIAHEREQCSNDIPLVRTEISQQTAHKARVIGLPENVFLVERH